MHRWQYINFLSMASAASTLSSLSGVYDMLVFKFLGGSKSQASNTMSQAAELHHMEKSPSNDQDTGKSLHSTCI